MIRPCDALLLSVAVVWSAASPAAGALDETPSIGPFSIDYEADFDAAVMLSEASSQSVALDGRFRADFEAVEDSGRRWGLLLAAAGQSGDHRRGLQTALGEGPATGLVTGLGFVGAPSEDRFGLSAAEAYVRGRLFEVYAGLGPSAAVADRPRLSSALRLTRADGTLVEPIAGGLVDTGLSLSEPALGVRVRTRRIVGLVFGASFTPTSDPCGIERCLDAQAGRAESVVALSVNFDRRDRQSGVRWTAHVGLERGGADAQAPALAADLEDPWLVSGRVVREVDDTAIALSAAFSNDGRSDGDYHAISATLSHDKDDWRFSAQIGHARSDLIDQSSWTGQLGASRFVGEVGLVGLGIQFQSDEAAALVVETGLRF